MPSNNGRKDKNNFLGTTHSLNSDSHYSFGTEYIKVQIYEGFKYNIISNGKMRLPIHW